MAEEHIIYICPRCFRICESKDVDHEHPRLIACNVGEEGDERRKPITDEHGNLLSRAPRWFLEGLGVVETE